MCIKEKGLGFQPVEGKDRTCRGSMVGWGENRGGGGGQISGGKESNRQPEGHRYVQRRGSYNHQMDQQMIDFESKKWF